jgi:hypothetical protein
MENASESLKKAASSFQRFDDIVRSERYFTATLLPAILFHDTLRGVRSFVELVDAKAKTECNRSGDRVSKAKAEYDDFKDVEVITEFHIARDLIFAGLRLEANVEPSEEGEPEERRDAPDLVITAGRELVVCEGKFFSVFNAQALNNQLRSQRCQLRHLFLHRQIRAYRHVAIVPPRRDLDALDLDADAVLTWNDIREFAEKLMGPDHYVTIRLREAVKRHKPVDNIPPIPPPRWNSAVRCNAGEVPGVGKQNPGWAHGRPH